MGTISNDVCRFVVDWGYRDSRGDYHCDPVGEVGGPSFDLAGAKPKIALCRLFWGVAGVSNIRKPAVDAR